MVQERLEVGAAQAGYSMAKAGMEKMNETQAGTSQSGGSGESEQQPSDPPVHTPHIPAEEYRNLRSKEPQSEPFSVQSMNPMPQSSQNTEKQSDSTQQSSQNTEKQSDSTQQSSQNTEKQSDSAQQSSQGSSSTQQFSAQKEYSNSKDQSQSQTQQNTEKESNQSQETKQSTHSSQQEQADLPPLDAYQRMNQMPKNDPPTLEVETNQTFQNNESQTKQDFEIGNPIPKTPEIKTNLPKKDDSKY